MPRNRHSGGGVTHAVGTHPAAVPEKVALPSALPLARHVSVVGTQAVLLIFTALYLPRSTSSIMGEDFLPLPSSSLDRPQSPFLNPLTASPVLTLAWLSAGSALITSYFAGYVRMWLRRPQPQIDTVEAARELAGRHTKGKALCGAWFAVIIAIPCFFVCLVLLGAPLKSHILQSILLSLLLSELTVFTPIYCLGLPSLASSPEASAYRSHYVRLFVEMSIQSAAERALVYPVWGSVIGCWVGSWVLPLDWDRPWQAWPLAPAYMALMGNVSGSIISLAVSCTLSLADLGR